MIRLRNLIARKQLTIKVQPEALMPELAVAVKDKLDVVPRDA